MAAIEAVVFDLDDTLYSERSFAFSGFRAVAAAFRSVLGEPTQAVARMQALFDTDCRGRVFDRMLEAGGIAPDPQLIARMVETYHTHHPGIVLFADADAALTRLRPTFRLGVISDGPPIMQARKIDALDLRARLDHMILTADLGPEFGKPHPRAFEAMADALGTPAEHCAYVADNAAKDFVAPNTLGWLSVQIERVDGVYAGRPPASGGVPSHRIRSLDELDCLLG